MTFSQQNVTAQTSKIGYGLIGAYILVFVGIAVSILTIALVHAANSLTLYVAIDGPIPAFDVQIYHNDARRAYLNALQQDYRCRVD